MARRSTAPSAKSAEVHEDGLQDAITELAQSVRVLTDLVQEVREDLNWISRNGVPHQPVTVRLERALPTSAEDPEALRAVVTSTGASADSRASADDLQPAFEWLPALHANGVPMLSTKVSSQQPTDRFGKGPEFTEFVCVEPRLRCLSPMSGNKAAWCE